MQSAVVSRSYTVERTRITEVVDFMRSNNFVGIMQSDTLMAIDPKADSLQPMAVISRGVYSRPEEYKTRGIEGQYPAALFHGFPGRKISDGQFVYGRKAWLQFYDRADGRLVYSNSGVCDNKN